MTSTERRRQLRVALLRRRELVALRAVAGRRTPTSAPASSAISTTATPDE